MLRINIIENFLITLCLHTVILLSPVFKSSAHAETSCKKVLVTSKASFLNRPTYSEITLETDRQRLISDENAELLSFDEFLSVYEITNQVLDVTEDIDNSAFIGVGRSPSTITAMMKAMGMPNVYELPLSSFKSRSDLSFIPSLFKILFLNGHYTQRYSKEKEEILYQHFKTFLPTDPVDVDGKTIYLLDLVITGAGLVAAADYIAKFYKDLGLNVRIKVVAFVPEELKVKHLVAELFFAEKIPFDRMNSTFGSKLFSQKYDVLAPFGQYNPSVQRWRPRLNPLYNRLIKEFEKFLNNLN